MKNLHSQCKFEDDKNSDQNYNALYLRTVRNLKLHNCINSSPFTA